jgi:hypothetical protein
MARNVAYQEGRRINEFTTAVFDLHDLGPDLHHEAPKTDARYYYRPFKTILVRTVQDGGESFYVRGSHRATLPALYRLVVSGSTMLDSPRPGPPKAGSHPATKCKP